MWIEELVGLSPSVQHMRNSKGFAHVDVRREHEAKSERKKLAAQKA